MRRISIAMIALVACGGATPGSGGPDASPDAALGGHVEAVRLPQTQHAAAWVDPDAYASIPVRVIVDGDAASVDVSIDGASSSAAHDPGGAWIATVATGALADGTHELVATARGGDGSIATTDAELVAGRSGIEWTAIGTDGNAGTPRLFAGGDTLYAAWTDRSDGTRSAWLRPIDGAGRAIGPRVRLAGGSGQPDVLDARTAMGASSIGVLYQQPGGPYASFFTMVTPTGTQTLAPIALDPADRFGSFGGDVSFDPSDGAFAIVWRTNDGAGKSDVRWMRVDEATGAVTGPIVVAAAGDDDPHGGFDPFTFVGVRASGDATGASVVAFLRDEHSALLQQDVPKCQLASLTAAGAITSTTIAEAGTGLLWDHECRIVGASPTLIWGASDLTSSDANPPVGFFGAVVTAGALPGNRGDGHLVVTAADNRTEPTIVDTAAPTPTIAWLDERTYTDPASGRIELYTAPLAADLSAGAPVVFEHARFVEGTSELSGTAIGANAMLAWIDERHGGTVVDPKPEVFFETVWR